MNYGKIVSAVIHDENDEAYFVQIDGMTFSILKSEVQEHLEKGESVEGVIYETRYGKKIMQLDLPQVRPGYYGWGKAVSVRRDLGVFIDIGLHEKEVVLSYEDLPENTKIWPKAGDQLYITYEIDKKNRFWAKLATPLEWQQQFKKAPERLMNQNLTVTVLQVKLSGVIAISTEGYRVFVHESEQTTLLRMGEVTQVRVIKVQKDGSLNASMKPRTHEVISDDAEMLIALLKKTPDGFLPLHDKSQPEVIQEQLGISKAQFKRSVGQLLKQKRIRMDKNKGIYLNV